MSGLVTLAEARAALRLGREDTTLDAELGRIIDSATELIETHFGVGIQRSFTEAHWGQTNVLWLNRYPVVSLTAVTVDGVALGDLSHYVLPSDTFGAMYGHAHRPSKPKGCVVQYVAGNFATASAVSAHWKEGALMQIRHMWRPYQENTGEVNEFDTAQVSTNTAGLARGLMAHFHGNHLPGLA